MNWDSSTIWIIVAVVALLALYFYNRSRPAPRGTYDDQHTRSSGSIGGGQRAHDDPAHRSSGSIGGGQRGYDAPEHESRGSIGGSTTQTQHSTNAMNGERTVERDLNRDLNRDLERDFDRGIDHNSPNSPLERLADERTHQGNAATHNPLDSDQQPGERQHNDDRFKSKGSIGG